MSRAIRSRRLIGGLLVLALVGLCALVMASAQAIPDDGPKPDTPGTSSRVWPKQVAPGGILNFEVSGFPANETVYIKIDDGTTCSDSSHGACVYHTQKLNGSGYAKGSLRLPTSLKPGNHWLRMLGTGDVFDDKTGEKLGYQGYTRRGGNDFTVVTSNSTTDDTPRSTDTDNPGTSDTGEPTTTDEGTAQPDQSGDLEGGTLALGSNTKKAKKDESSADTQESDSSVLVSDEQAPRPQVVAAPEAGSGPPTLGIVLLAGAVVIGAAAVGWALLSRRRFLAASAAG